MPVKFQSDRTILNTNLAASRLYKILRKYVFSDIETESCGPGDYYRYYYPGGLSWNQDTQARTSSHLKIANPQMQVTGILYSIELQLIDNDKDAMTARRRVISIVIAMRYNDNTYIFSMCLLYGDSNCRGTPLL